LGSIELIIPAAASGALFPGWLFFAYLGIRTRQGLHYAVTAVTGIGFLFALGELLVVHLGGVQNNFAHAAQVYRLQQVAVTWLLAVLPLFLRTLLTAVYGFSGRLNRAVTTAGTLLATALTVIAFVEPDWFRSVSEQSGSAAVYESAFGRGAAGWAFTARDIGFALVFMYVGVRIVQMLFAAPKRRYLLILLVGLALGMLFSAGDVLNGLANMQIGPFAERVYPRSVVGISLFLLFAVLSALTRYIDLAQDVEAAHVQLQANERELSYMAYFDTLTGVRNRKAFYEEAARELTRHTPGEDAHPVAVLYVDLDRFKEINDSYGHAVGDRVLREAARRFSARLRQSDGIFRIGGDEFLVFLPTLKNPADAGVVAQKLIDALSGAIVVDEVDFYIGTCVGISVHPDDGEDVEALVKSADRALYEAKKQRNTYKYYDAAMQQTAIRNVRIISGLRRAVADKELSLQFQPIFTADSTLDGAEALLRWHHPEWGAIPPATFIPLAEGSGLIAEIGRWVIEEAVDTYREIRARGGRTNISVNLSTKQLLHPSFIEEVLDLFADNDVEPSAFCLEITENSLFEDTTTAITRLRDAGQQGLTFAIDDFGKGFSALAYLKELPVHLVKIDKSFVQGLPENPRDAAVVDGVLSIARGMGFDVVAEGIETDAQRGYLAARGCRFFQGFGLARPMSRADFVAEASKGEAPDAHTPGSGVDAPGSGLDAPNSQN
jgi:diguanylate cyclase (GGDEF)-like protein